MGSPSLTQCCFSCSEVVRGAQDERKAFAKACAYLNYNTTAKRLALAASVGMALLSIGLLFVLWLFADLMVSRSQLPAFDALSLRDATSSTNGGRPCPLRIARNTSGTHREAWPRR